MTKLMGIDEVMRLRDVIDTHPESSIGYNLKLMKCLNEVRPGH